ncbi:hypothetical protein F6X40_10725 [Paraburkholderia sp. UCT31]|uniref:hypothetical protein n=1 Tax=Paraburkholderia sp. UCT31 TaxID=2615209 RepID=UPI001656682F|nr:hypothetical protein [Paraburkholderia sp. UCT31]MBC8737282.1 hypothetical protein [Paraburkholderia sp. UCT31]
MSLLKILTQPIGGSGKNSRHPSALPTSYSPSAISRGKRKFAKQRANFYEDLAESLKDKAVLVVFLQKHIKREHKKGSPLAALYSLWLKRMDTMSFSGAVKGTVPPMDSLILVAAETSGDLPKGLAFLAENVRAIEKIKATLIGAIVTPVIVSSMIIGMLVGFQQFMAPILKVVVPVDHWPKLGKLLNTVSTAVVNLGAPGAVALALAIVAFAWSLPNWSGAARVKVDKYIPYSLYRDYFGAVTLVSLGGLMQSGSSLVGSLTAIRSFGSRWMAWHINRILLLLDEESAAPAKAFDTGILPEDLYERVVDYGERSSFQDALGKIGNQAIEKVSVSVTKKAKIMNTVLMALSGMTLAMMIGAVMLTAQQARQEIQSTMNAAH